MKNKQETKMCSNCRQEKDIGEFYRDKRDNSFRGQCKKCCIEHDWQTHLKNKERLFQEHNKYQLENPITHKKCCWCKKEKPVSEFNKNKRKKDGLDHRCRICKQAQKKQTHLKNKERLFQKHTKYQLENTLERKICSYCELKKNIMEFYKCKRNKDGFQNKCISCEKQYHKEHFYERKIYSKQWDLENREERNKYRVQRRKTNPAVKIIQNVRDRMNDACKAQGIKKPMHTIELLGCTALEYQEYLRSLFKPGMIMKNNKNTMWQQHHIISFSSVDLSDIEQLKKVCHYTNIIPMWEDEHIEWHKTHGR